MQDLVGIAAHGDAVPVVFPEFDVVEADGITGDLQRFVEPVVQVHNPLIMGRGLSGVLGQVPADRAGPADCLDDLPGLLLDGLQIGFLR